jgi:hypothetical protein
MAAKKRIQIRNGVRVIVHVQDGGTTVESDCGCFGMPFRTHTNMICPLSKRQQAQRTEQREAA